MWRFQKRERSRESSRERERSRERSRESSRTLFFLELLDDLAQLVDLHVGLLELGLECADFVLLVRHGSVRRLSLGAGVRDGGRLWIAVRARLDGAGHGMVLWRLFWRGEVVVEDEGVVGAWMLALALAFAAVAV